MTLTGLGAGRHAALLDEPEGVVTTVHRLATADGAEVSGVLRTPRSAQVAVTLMHPRQDVTHHASVPHLLRSGYAVWTQGSRSPNNDLNLIHEQALVDFAAGHVRLRTLGFEHVVCLGHSGGATLAAFYCEQARLAPSARLNATPAGRPVPLADTEMPLPEGCVFMAPHPGQGALLQRVIDPSVTDESDPLSVDPDLDPFAAANGFVPAPAPTAYDPKFVRAYREAQRARVARIDARAGEWVAEAAAARRDFTATDDPADRRRTIAPRILTTYRTDADLRNVDLSIDPNSRRYGSLFGRRPDLTNYGLVGFGRLATAEAWLSTWSANATRADFARCAPGVKVPALLLELTGDQASFPADIARYGDALGSDDRTVASVPGTHFGGPLAKGEPTGTELAAAVIQEWIDARR